MVFPVSVIWIRLSHTKTAMRELEERYGDKQMIAHTYVKRALNWPVVRGDGRALDRFFDLFYKRSKARFVTYAKSEFLNTQKT